MNNLYTQFRGDKMWNHVHYSTPLITLEISDKEGATVDTVFCSSLICMPYLEKPKNIIFSPWGHENISNGVAQLVQTLDCSKCIFQPKWPKWPWSTFGWLKVKILTKEHFHGFISNPSSSDIFSNFDQVWPRFDFWWAPEIIILI